MSIFRNRSNSAPQRQYEEQREGGEPRLFTQRPVREREEQWCEAEESQYQGHRQSQGLQSEENIYNHPQWQGRGSRVEDAHPRELSFWREEKFYDDYAHRSVRPSPGRFILLVASLVIIATFAWLAFRWISAPQGAAPPMIYADSGAYKVRPDNPGGMQVPNQDRLVYNRLNPSAQQPVERLLPPPEQPISQGIPQQGVVLQQNSVPSQGVQQQQPQQQAVQPQVGYPAQVPNQAYVAQPNYQQQPNQGYSGGVQQGPIQQPQQPQQNLPIGNNAQQYPSVQQAMPPQNSQQIQGQQAQTPPVAQQQRATLSESIDEIIEDDLKGTKKPKSTVAKAEKEEAQNSLPMNKHRIQVATLAGRETAKKEYERIISNYPDLTVIKVKGKEQKLKGVYKVVEGQQDVYRIMFGPFGGRNEAVQQCSKFRTHGFSCIVLKPN